jgi:hypothetical protein
MVDKQYDGYDVLINFYHGVDGPTIRIDTRSTDSIAQIRDTFLELASGDLDEIAFLAIQPTKIVKLRGLVLATAGDVKGEKRLEMVVDAADGPQFYWHDSRDGWAEAAELVSAMLEDPRPSHQYLTSTSTDDALVIVALLET